MIGSCSLKPRQFVSQSASIKRFLRFSFGVFREPNKKLNDWSCGKQRVLFPRDPETLNLRLSLFFFFIFIIYFINELYGLGSIGTQWHFYRWQPKNVQLSQVLLSLLTMQRRQHHFWLVPALSVRALYKSVVLPGLFISVMLFKVHVWNWKD